MDSPRTDPYYLGRLIKSIIPSGPRRYRTWLEKTRAEFSRMEDTLEQEVLMVPKARLDQESSLGLWYADTGIESVKSPRIFRH